MKKRLSNVFVINKTVTKLFFRFSFPNVCKNIGREIHGMISPFSRVLICAKVPIQRNNVSTGLTATLAALDKEFT